MARNFGRGRGDRGRGRGRSLRDLFQDKIEETKYDKVAAQSAPTGPSTEVNKEEAKQAEIAAEVAVIEAKAEQPSIEEKRLIEAGVKPESNQKQVTSQAALAQTEEIIRTPQALKDRLALPTSKLPAMETDVEPENPKLPATQDVVNEDMATDTSKPAEEMISMYHGGTVMPVGLMGPDGIIGYDEVSGNPIPIGSSAENVRDDIPAALSQGEYVVPADVVSYFGLRHFMEMRQEAKMGLMAMHCEGQIHTDYSDAEMVEEEYEGDEEEAAVEQAEVVTEVEEFVPEEEDSEGVEEYATEGGRFTVGDEQVLLIFKSLK